MVSSAVRQSPRLQEKRRKKVEYPDPQTAIFITQLTQPQEYQQTTLKKQRKKYKTKKNTTAGKIQKPKHKNIGSKKVVENLRSSAAKSRWKTQIAVANLVSQDTSVKHKDKVDAKQKIQAVVHARDMDISGDQQQQQQQQEIDDQGDNSNQIVLYDTMSKAITPATSNKNRSLGRIFPIFSYIYGRMQEIIFPKSSSS